jgi:hypothetical protein
MCLDANKEVQKSGCSTLAIIEEEAGEGLELALTYSYNSLLGTYYRHYYQSFLTLSEEEFVGSL